MNRNLDGYYFRVKIDGKWDNVCWSDMTDEERDEQMTNRSEEWLKSLCKGLGNVIHKIGELRMDTVIHATDRFADFKQRRACIISNFIFPDHTAFDLFK